MPRVAPFEAHHRRYEDWFAQHETAYQSELLAVRALLPWQGRGLEIGVGSGRFAGPLGVRVGVDPSPATLKYASARGVLAVQGVAEALPFRDAAFDHALIVTTLCFVDDARAMLAEARRVLRPGGLLIIGFIDRASDLGQVYLARQAAHGKRPSTQPWRWMPCCGTRNSPISSGPRPSPYRSTRCGRWSPCALAPGRGRLWWCGRSDHHP